MTQVLRSILDLEKLHGIDTPAEREQRFRRMFDDGPIGMALLGTDYRFLGVNRAFCEMLGYDAEELLGRSFADVTHPDDVGQGIEVAKRVFTGKETYVRLEKRYLTPKKQVVHVQLTAWPIRNADGVVTHTVAVALDITAQKTARARATRLRRALEERDTLLREIHHRVKNNLQVVSSLLTLQLGHIQDPEMQVLVQESQARIAAMALVHEKLYQADDLSHVDLQGYLRGVADAVGHAYASIRRHVDVAMDIEPVSLDLDSAVRCGLVVNELVSNAYKHAFLERTMGRIVVRLSTREGGVVELDVADDGVGIPPDVVLDRVETLGLQLVRHLTKQLGGRLELIREHGTKFAISFPVRRPATLG